MGNSTVFRRAEQVRKSLSRRMLRPILDNFHPLAFQKSLQIITEECVQIVESIIYLSKPIIIVRSDDDE